MAEIFPDSWRHPNMLPYVLDFLDTLPLSRKDRKRTFEEWAHWAGVKLTAALVRRALRLPSGETKKPKKRPPEVVKPVVEPPPDEPKELEKPPPEVVEPVVEPLPDEPKELKPLLPEIVKGVVEPPPDEPKKPKPLPPEVVKDGGKPLSGERERVSK